MNKDTCIMATIFTLLAIVACILASSRNTISEVTTEVTTTAEPEAETTTPEVETTTEAETTTEKIETEPITIPPVEQPTEPELIDLGEFRLTAYCSCKKCCGKWGANRGEEVVGAIGKVLTAGYSIAVDPKVIPYGSIVVINGKEYEAMDCGGAIKKNRIDIYFNTHDEALEFGVQYATVYLKQEVTDEY